MRKYGVTHAFVRSSSETETIRNTWADEGLDLIIVEALLNQIRTSASFNRVTFVQKLLLYSVGDPTSWGSVFEVRGDL